MRFRAPAHARSFAIAVLALGLASCGRTDPAIQAAVDSELASDPVTASLTADVSVIRGVVRLSGEVQSREQGQRAVAIARSVGGVDDVVDDLRRGDAALAAAVRQALAADPLVGGVPIIVESAAGIVRLMSDQTDRDQRVRAVAIAAAVDGVGTVEDLMR